MLNKYSENGSEAVKSSPKPCPQRLNAGFRGTMSDFKHEIERCFLYGWFFEELLDDKQKAEIPGLMEVTKKKIEERNRKAREARWFNIPF